MDFLVSADHENKRKQNDWQILVSCQWAEKAVECESGGFINLERSPKACKIDGGN